MCHKCHRELVDALLEVPGIDDPATRTALLANIPNRQSFMRNHNSTYDDLSLLVSALFSSTDRRTGEKLLKIFIENTKARVAGITLYDRLEHLYLQYEQCNAKVIPRSATITRTGTKPIWTRRSFLMAAGAVASVGLAVTGGELLLHQGGSVPPTPTPKPTPTPTPKGDAKPSILNKPPVTYKHASVVSSVAWSPTKDLIASASVDGEIHIWDALNYKGGDPIIKYRLPLQGDNTPNAVWCIAWSPDGRLLASASADPLVRIWDGSQQKDGPLITCTGHTNSVNSVAWSHDGNHILSGGSDNTVRVWSSGGQPEGTHNGSTNTVTSVAWSLDGARIAGGNRDKNVIEWDALTSASPPLYTFSKHGAAVNCISWSHDGNYIASASDDRTVQVWDYATGDVKKTYQHHDVVNPVAWSPKDTYIISGSWDKTARIWDAMSGKTIAISQLHADHVNAVAWSRDGNYVVTGGKDTYIYVCRVF